MTVIWLTDFMWPHPDIDSDGSIWLWRHFDLIMSLDFDLTWFQLILTQLWFNSIQLDCLSWVIHTEHSALLFPQLWCVLLFHKCHLKKYVLHVGKTPHYTVVSVRRRCFHILLQFISYIVIFLLCAHICPSVISIIHKSVVSNTSSVSSCFIPQFCCTHTWISMSGMLT